MSIPNADINILEFFPDLKNNIEQLDELKNYYNNLDLLVTHNMSLQFNNSDKNHAAIVMNKIFQYSSSHIKMFSGKLSGEISDNKFYLKGLKSFLEEGKKIEVIFEETPNVNSEAYKVLKSYQANSINQVSLSQATSESLAKIKTALVKDKMIHFAIGDNESNTFDKYRCETDIEKFVAVLNFHDEKFCMKLETLFNILKTDSSIIN